MKDDSQICRFYWRIDNPFLPLEKKEAVFHFGSPELTKWKVSLQPGRGSPLDILWPITFSLQYLSLDSQEDKVVSLAVTVSVNFVDIANDIPMPVSFVFDGTNTYSCKSFIRPEHGKLDIEVEIVIPDQAEEDLKIRLEPLRDLSKDLERLLSDHLYFDVWLQSREGGARFPVHSYILNSRWFDLFKVLAVQPNPEDPPTAETPVPPDVLNYILTYLYTASTKHPHLANRNFVHYTFDLLLTLKKYPMYPLYMMLSAEPNGQNWETKTHVSSTAVTFRLEEAGELGLYAWTHSLLPDVSVTTFLKFALTTSNGPSFSYSLRFTNPIKLFTRVNLEYRRKVVGLGIAEGAVVYEADHEVPCNGIHVPMPDIRLKGNLAHLMEFIDGKDRVDGGYEVEHSFRFILYLSNGENCIRVSTMKSFDPEVASLRILRKNMSTTLERKIGAILQVVGKEANSETHLIHKGIFAVRVPKWRNAIENVPKENNIPNNVKCTVSSKALPFIIEYLYTATCSLTPNDLNIIISDFARDGGVSSLESDIFAIAYERMVKKNFKDLVTV